MKINLNQQCTIVLRKRGVEALYKYYTKHRITFNYKIGDLYKGPLWFIMHIFGADCCMGPEVPFDTEIGIQE